MASNYKRIGNYIRQVDVRNTDLSVGLLLGVSIEKKFIESHANTLGTDFSKYKIVKRGQFAYGPVTSRNGDKISIALLDEADACLISSSYTPFEIVKPDELNAEYLMMLFRNPEYDRFARYNSWGSAREVFSWEDFCDSELYIPDIEEQQKIVRQYKTITDRIEVLEKINDKLIEQAMTVFNKFYGEYLDVESDKIVPENMELCSIEKICEFVNGYAFDSEDMKDSHFPGSMDVFKQGNILKGGGINHLGTKSWIDRKLCEKQKKVFSKKYDVLMAMTDMKENIALLGHTAIMDIDDKYVINQRVGILRCNGYKHISPYYLYLLTNNKTFIEKLRLEAHYGVQVNLSKGDITSMPIVIGDDEINANFNHEVEKQIELFMTNTHEILTLSNLVETLLKKLI